MMSKLKYGWVLYVVLALGLWGAIDQKTIGMQVLGRFQSSARSLLDRYFEPDLPNPKTLRQSIIYYRTLGKFFGNTPPENNTLGYCFYLLHDYPKASLYFKKATEGAPNRYAVFFNLGMSYFKQGLYTQAEQAFTQAGNLLNSEEYFKKEIFSPYNGGAMQKSQAFILASWHCNQMVQLSHKAKGHALNAEEATLKAEWDEHLLRQRLFYWVPQRSVKVEGNDKVTL